MQPETENTDLFDWAPVALAEVDSSGRLRRVNQTACNLFGFSREQLQSTPLINLVAPSDREDFRRNFDERLHGIRSLKPFERLFVSASGTTLCTEVHVTLISGPNGAPNGFRFAVIDLTERRAVETAQEVLLEKERLRKKAQVDDLIAELDFHRVRWEAILRQLPGGVLVIDAHGHVMLTNDWMQKLMKRPLPNIETASLGGVMAGWHTSGGSPYPVSRWPPLHCLQTGESVIREEILFDVDGHVQAHLEVSASPIKDRENNIIAVGCLFFDVTAQRLSENSFRVSEARYRAIFEQDIAANFILTRRLDLVACNTAAVALFGFRSKKEMFTASSKGKFPSPADRTAILKRATESPIVERGYLRLHRSDGTPTLVSGSVRVVREPGAPSEIHAHLADVTERRRAERKVATLSTQLLQVQNEERRKLSHDLHDSTGQNLSALSMNLGLIEAALPVSPEKAAGHISECKDLVQDCIRDIRTISYTLHPPLLDELGLDAALRWFIEGFSKRSSIDVQLDVMDDLGRLGRLVEIALFRIVQEGLTNVHRHSGSKTASVRVRRDAVQLTLVIADQGRGITPSLATPGMPGAGVGLTSIRQQLSFVNGHLEIVPGEGAQLIATIPTKALRNS